MGNGGWGRGEDQSADWITRCIYGLTGGNDYNKTVVSILWGRETVQIRRQINARESHRIVCRAKRFLESMEYYRFSYNFERMCAGRQALTKSIQIRLRFYDDGDIDMNRKFYEDSKK